MNFEAKYPGTCAGCYERISIGDLCTYAEDSLVHWDCDGAIPIERPVTVCDRCWLTKPCDCDAA